MCLKASAVSALRADRLKVKPCGLGSCALVTPKPAGLHFQYLRAQLGEKPDPQFQKPYSMGILYTYLYFTFCNITNITGTMMSVRKNENTTP